MKNVKRSAGRKRPQPQPQTDPAKQAPWPARKVVQLDDMLLTFNIKRHGGEAMPWPPVGGEIQ